ncbi:hypothetical protein ACFX2C_030960 [Malus domestica]
MKKRKGIEKPDHGRFELLELLQLLQLHPKLVLLSAFHCEIFLLGLQDLILFLQKLQGFLLLELHRLQLLLHFFEFFLEGRRLGLLLLGLFLRSRSFGCLFGGGASLRKARVVLLCWVDVRWCLDRARSGVRDLSCEDISCISRWVFVLECPSAGPWLPLGISAIAVLAMAEKERSEVEGRRLRDPSYCMQSTFGSLTCRLDES